MTLTAQMIPLILAIAAPIVLAPLIAWATRRLFGLFLREGAELFVGMDLHRGQTDIAGTSIAINNVIIFALAWWGAVALGATGQSMFLIVAPFIAAVPLGVWVASLPVKSHLHIERGDAWLVALLAFAGGNLPLILLMPVILSLVPHA
jgi:hypothetical protein